MAKLKRQLALWVAENGGWQRIIERIADGETVGHIAQSINLEGHGPISRSWLSHQINGNPKRKELVREARSIAAGAYAEKAMDIADEVLPDRDHVAKAKLRVDLLMKHAASLDPQTWGEKKEPAGVTVNIQTLHMDALRWREIAPEAVEALPETTVESE